MNLSKNTALLSSWIDEAKVVSTVCHGRPDGDAAGSSAAMLSYLISSRGKDAAALIPGRLPGNIAFVLEGVNQISDVESAAARLRDTDLLICLDFNTLSRTEEFETIVREYPGRKVLIDHHKDPDVQDFDLCISETAISSACELLYNVLLGMPDIAGDARKLPPATARALMTGMTTDTNNFANSVYPGTLKMASELLDAGVDREDLIDRLYSSERPNRLAAMGEMLSDRMRLLPCGVSVIVLHQDFFDRYDLRDGETEGFVNLPLAVKDVRLSVFAREDGNFFRVSIRSKRGVSARLLAKNHFHGGGHEQASGGRIFIPQDVLRAGDVEAYVIALAARFMQETASVN